MKKYYYNNLLANQNITAKPNIAWVADLTTVSLPNDSSSTKNPKLHLFLCIDIFSNMIIGSHVSLRTIESRKITTLLAQSIEERFVWKPETKLIIHTDRGTQFSSEIYYQFTKTYAEYFEPSMSRLTTPTDNAVAERFMRTFKEHKIGDKTFEKALHEKLIQNPKFRHYRSLVKEYIKSLNLKPNRKTENFPPEQKDIYSHTASLLMTEPIYSKAFSEHYGTDFRREHINQYKKENSIVTDCLKNLEAKHADVVSKTPFDSLDYEDRIALQKVEQSISELRKLILENSEITRQYVFDAVEPLQYTVESIDRKIDMLLPKAKKAREILKLRDPITNNLFPIFLANAASKAKYQRDLKNSQLRICYTILFHTGTRVNEIRNLTYEDIQDAMKISQFSLIHFKTRQPYVHVLSNQALEDLKKLKLDYVIVFEKYKYKYLFGKRNPINEKSLIRFVNDDLKQTCQAADLPFNIKSHSFRINVISSLLKFTTIQNVANIIGHDDIRSTMRYRRYSLSKKEIKDLMDKIQQSNDEE